MVIILIGMPGCGKTCMGKALGRKLKLKVIDGDALIEKKYGKRLHEIIEDRGLKEFKRIEEETLLSISGDDIVISTGGSVLEVVDALKEAGAEVLGVVSIFTYGMEKGLKRLAEANVKNVSLTNFDVIAETAAEEGYIKEEDVKRLIAFRNNPSDESWIKA